MAYPDDLLVDGEKVTWHAHPHWSTQVRPAAAFPLVAAVVGFGSATVRLQPWAPVAWAALGALGIVLVVRWTVLPLARWRATHLVVTDLRLLVREGLVARHGLDVPIERIVSVRVRGTPFGRLVGSGTLILDTGDGEPMRLRDVGRVERVQARLHREIGRVGARRRSETGTAGGVVPERSVSS